MSFQSKYKEAPIPETPLFLIILALLFVPGVYIVLILSIAITVAIGGGLIYGIWYICENWLPIIPVGVFFLLAIGTLIGIFAGLKGAFQSLWRKPGFEPAILIDMNKEPLLTSFISNLCDLMRTKLPNAIILHAQPTFFVQQGKLNVFNGKAKGRVLAIGLPLLCGLTVNELRTILSHEFAHFTGRDTQYSSFVLPVYIGTTTASAEMSAVIEGGSESGRAGCVAVPLILPNLLLSLYLRLFHLINMKISRWREKRADIIAVLTCGSDSFSSGLKRVAGLAGVFQTVSQTHIIDGLKEEKVFINYYSVFRDILPQLDDLASEYEKNALSELENIYNSHPTLNSRLDYIPKIAERYNDKALAISLLANLEEYEKTLTENYTQLLAIMSGYYGSENKGV